MSEVATKFRAARESLNQFITAYFAAEGTADQGDAEVCRAHLTAMLRAAKKTRLPQALTPLLNDATPAPPPQPASQSTSAIAAAAKEK